MYKMPDSMGGKWSMGPVWDYDLAYGNANYYFRQCATNTQIGPLAKQPPDDQRQGRRPPALGARPAQGHCAFATTCAAAGTSLRTDGPLALAKLESAHRLVRRPTCGPPRPGTRPSGTPSAATSGRTTTSARPTTTRSGTSSSGSAPGWPGWIGRSRAPAPPRPTPAASVPPDAPPGRASWSAGPSRCGAASRSIATTTTSTSSANARPSGPARAGDSRHVTGRVAQRRYAARHIFRHETDCLVQLSENETLVGATVRALALTGTRGVVGIQSISWRQSRALASCDEKRYSCGRELRPLGVHLVDRKD